MGSIGTSVYNQWYYVLGRYYCLFIKIEYSILSPQRFSCFHLSAYIIFQYDSILNTIIFRWNLFQNFHRCRYYVANTDNIKGDFLSMIALFLCFNNNAYIQILSYGIFKKVHVFTWRPIFRILQILRTT